LLAASTTNKFELAKKFQLNGISEVFAPPG
jgi:hypothetical protein